ncbi:MAG: hypothetical protein H0Z33_10725 [Bacillaceae bacterium]|nr:hypothetical protein [Bacillaceae bacterium]
MILRALLKHVFDPVDQPLQRMAVNIPQSDASPARILEGAGLTRFVEQVRMARTF